jgi:hypothetical protein
VRCLARAHALQAHAQTHTRTHTLLCRQSTSGAVTELPATSRNAAITSNLGFVAQLINKALGVAELILRDEKYRVVVKDTPDLINRILSLLDAVQTSENKLLLVKLIAVLGENSANKLEIGE